MCEPTYGIDELHKEGIHVLVRKIIANINIIQPPISKTGPRFSVCAAFNYPYIGKHIKLCWCPQMTIFMETNKIDWKNMPQIAICPFASLDSCGDEYKIKMWSSNAEKRREYEKMTQESLWFYWLILQISKQQSRMPLFITSKYILVTKINVIVFDQINADIWQK